MKPPTIKAIKRRPANGWRFAGATSGIGRMAMGEGRYDPGHFGVRHKLGRALEGEEFELRKRMLEIQHEVQIGLRCGTCLQSACSVEYGPFECRGTP